MRTFRMTLAYDGTRLIGWQRQIAGDSAQGLLEAALAKLEGGPVTVYGAGRTDAGVHALGQVASVRLACAHDTATLVRALNAQLPADLRVLSVDEVAPDFHARFDARWKTYRFMICTAPVASPFERAYVWHIPERLDVELMQQAAGALVGTHDFRAFQSAGSGTASTVRTVLRSELLDRAASPVDAAVQAPGSLLAYEIVGNGFLRHMVRAVVGTLIDVGRGRWPPERMSALLLGGERGHAGATAPPHGLFLVRVDYH
jgi:tRNA pseudouridine38-40 synthase